MLTHPTGAGPVVYAKEYSSVAFYMSKMLRLNLRTGLGFPGDEEKEQGVSTKKVTGHSPGSNETIWEPERDGSYTTFLLNTTEQITFNDQLNIK